MTTHSHTYIVARQAKTWVVDTVRTSVSYDGTGFTGTVNRWVIVENPGDTIIIDEHGTPQDWALANSEDSPLGDAVRFYFEQLELDQRARSEAARIPSDFWRYAQVEA